MKKALTVSVLLLSVLGPLVLLMLQPPIRQPQEYYDFADQRTLLGIPNFFDVTTNLVFLVVGIAGLRFCLKTRWDGMRLAWITLFLGMTSVSLGSGYFHWNPNDDTLIWDRASLTVAFMGLFVVILGEYVDLRLGRSLLIPAVSVGVGSVFYWHHFDDLRFYLWVQFMPLLVIPLVMVLFRSTFSHQGYLVASLVFYVLAKVTELLDRQIYTHLQGWFSGHSMKHLLAGLGCLALLLMLKRRRVREAGSRDTASAG